jgi:uncharacterized integral membrane protein
MSADDPDRPEDAAAREPATEPHEPRAGAEPERGAPFTQQLGRVVALAIAVLFGFFAVSNAQYVDFNWVFGGTEVEVAEATGERLRGGVRLIVLMVASFVAGVVVTGLVAWRRGRRRHRERRTD